MDKISFSQKFSQIIKHELIIFFYFVYSGEKAINSEISTKAIFTRR
jgi:hypothetical protein